MIIHRMTFDIAVENGAPDVYTLQSQIQAEIRNVGFVVGAEGIGNCHTVQSVNASEVIDRQIREREGVAHPVCRTSVTGTPN